MLHIVIYLVILLGIANSTEVGVVHLKGDLYDDSIHGFIYFVTLNSTHTWVWANITGITNTENGTHGMHVHTLGDITDQSAALKVGTHYIGSGEAVHACEDTLARHEGDMGNWEAVNGTILWSKTLDLVSNSGPFSIIGRSVVLHNLTDGCNNNATGENRLAQGVIGIANVTLSHLPEEVATVVNSYMTNISAVSGDVSASAIALIEPISGSNVSGQVTFEQVGDVVTIKAKILGLDTTRAYGFHIHIYGDMTSLDGTSAGGHYNPYNTSHGLASNDTRHVGDLGNICSFDETGVAYYNYSFSSLVTLSGPNNVIGRSVIIHSLRDDGGSYGSRIGQGVIGYGSYSTNITIPDMTINQPDCAGLSTTSGPIDTTATSSIDTATGSIDTTTGSIDTTTGSIDTTTGSLESTTSSSTTTTTTITTATIIHSSSSTTGKIREDENGMTGGEAAAITLVVIIVFLVLLANFLYYQKHKRMFWSRPTNTHSSIDYVAFEDKDVL